MSSTSFSKLPKNNILEGSEALVKVLTMTKSTHNAQIEIKFPYDNANLLTVEKGLIQLKGFTNEFVLERPVQKDWNDKLKRQKPFMVSVEKQGVELPEKRFSQGIEAFSYAEQKSLEQMGGIPLGGIPLGGIPMGGIPLGGIPMGGIPQQTVILYLEKYNLSYEVDKPQVFAIIKQGKIEEINPILKQEVEK